MEDITALTNTDGPLEQTFSALSNPMTGLGTSRAKNQHAQVSRTAQLSAFDRNALVEGSRIARKAVFLYP